MQDVSAGDNEARTPLHYAAGYNHAEIAIMLLEAGANLEARDSKVGHSLCALQHRYQQSDALC
jgi:ankyrin repeat protein